MMATDVTSVPANEISEPMTTPAGAEQFQAAATCRRCRVGLSWIGHRPGV
jgi:hypothetical protein